MTHWLANLEAREASLRHRPFRLFFSHTSAHRALAEEIGSRLRDLGLETFVAHSTITPTDEWQKAIEAALHSCDAMAALITPDFKSSEYCNQEIGVAIARNLLVIAVRQGADPHGFLRNQQGLPGDTSPAAGLLLADSIYDALLFNAETEAKMAQVLTYRYGRSRSYVEAFLNLKCLLEIPEDHWTSEMVSMVMAAERENPYVQKTNIAQDIRRHLEDLFGLPFLRMFD